MARALCSDPRTRQTWAQWQALAAQEQLDRAAAWPTGTARLDGGRAGLRLQEAGDRSRGTGRVFNVGLDATWLLYDFGQRSASLEAAQLAVLAAGASHDHTLQTVYLDAVKAYYALAEAKGQQQWSRHLVRVSEELVRQASRARGETGPITPLERLQAQTGLARLRSDLGQWEGALRLARGELAARIGEQPTALVDIESADAPPSDRGWGANVEQLIEVALRDHPELRMARARLASTQAQSEALRRSERPTLAAVSEWQRGRDAFGSQTTEHALGLQLRIPLFSKSAAPSRARLAQANVDAARADLQVAEQQASLETWAAYLALQTHWAALQSAEHFLQTAQALLNAELRAFQEGQGDLFDALEAHDAVAEAARAQLSSISALHVQRLRLAASLGRLRSEAVR